MSQHRLVSPTVRARQSSPASPTSRPTGRPVRRTLPTGVRRGLQAGLVVGLVAATVASVPQSAQAQTERVLQSVSVDLGPDGTISSVSSRAIRKDGADISSDADSLDPATAAGDLPVRVQTSYVMGDRTGTDLHDIVGRSGTVVIHVTVQNTTVRPRELSFDAGGAQQHQYALVGTPLTVVGSATLGKGDLGHVVTTGATTPGSTGRTSSAVTNGVLSQSGDGVAHVQWAAMLAPPRLSPSTTFTLVEDTASFTVPTFDLNVQPGLSTDTSAQALLDQAFSEDGSTAQLESKTISLIGDVDNVLSEAGVQLGQVRDNLSSTADSFGTRTIADLQTGRQQVDQHLTTVIDNLVQLRSDIADRLRTGQSTVLQSLDKSLAGVIDVVGTPGQPMPVLTTPDTSCAATVPVVRGDGRGLSVLQELQVVGAQLSAIDQSMPACRAEIKSSLETTIGNVSRPCPALAPPGGALSAICTLQAARTELGQQSGAVSGLGTDLQNDVSALGVGGLGQDISTLTGQVVDAQAAASALAHPGSGPGGVTTAVDPILDQLGQLKTSLGEVAATLQGVDLGPLRTTYTQLSGLASQQLQALDPSSASSTTLFGLTSQLSSALAGLCPQNLVAAGLDSLPSGLSGIISSLLGSLISNCSTATTALGQLDGLLHADHDAWSTVSQAAGDTSALDAATGALSTLGQQIQDLQGAVDHALADSGDAASLRHDLITLQSQLGGLYDAHGGSGAPLNALQTSFSSVQANAGALDKTISDGITGLQQVFSQSQTDLGTKVLQTDNARATAESTVDDSIDSLSQALTSSRSQLLAKGSTRLATARTDVAASGDRAATSLGAATDGVVSSIASSVDAANTNLGATSQQLSGDLSKVLVDLGTRQDGGTGILGTLTTSAAGTSTSAHDIARIGQTADDFQHVRSTELDDVYLQQEQTDASLAQQRSLPTFGLSVPDGTQVLTVFAYHLEG